MNCHLCEIALEGQAQTTQPCGCVSHTTCAYRYLVQEAYTRNTVICRNCNAAIYSDPPNPWALQQEVAAERVNTLSEQDDFKKDLSEFKKTMLQLHKSSSAFKKIIIEQHRVFKNLVQPSIAEIKLQKERILRNINSHDVARGYRKALSAMTAKKTRFTRKYAVNILEMRQLGLRRDYSTSWYLRRKFRIRL